MRNIRVRQPGRFCARRDGFTMAEMVVAVTIMVIVTAVVASLFVQVRKMIGLTQWAAETRTQVRAAVDTLAQDLQNIDDSTYFAMLNRDYYWDSANLRAARLYRDDPTAAGPKNVDRVFWADRIAFLAGGHYNTLIFDPTSGNPPATGTSARVYYGHSLWTHEIPDAVWDAVSVTPPNTITAPLKPTQVAQWTGYFRDRPAVDWVMVRQAVIKTDNPAANRITEDNEYWLVDNAALPEYPTGATTAQLLFPSDLTRWIDGHIPRVSPPALLLPPSPGQMNWLALLWPPRVYSVQRGSNLYDQNLAPARILLPHAARLRFQVRLSDGSIVPAIDDTGTDLNARGRLLGTYDAANPPINGVNPDCSLSLPQPLAWPPPPAATTLLDPSVIGRTPPPASDPTVLIPVAQAGYIWTANKANLKWDTAQTTNLYPVALRIRAEVYDPQKRTPDPIKVDEWLPIRWGSRPVP